MDCSACSYLPLKAVDSYRCNVRCEAQGISHLLKLIDLNAMTCIEFNISVADLGFSRCGGTNPLGGTNI